MIMMPITLTEMPGSDMNELHGRKRTDRDFPGIVFGQNEGRVKEREQEDPHLRHDELRRGGERRK